MGAVVPSGVEQARGLAERKPENHESVSRTTPTPLRAIICGIYSLAPGKTLVTWNVRTLNARRRVTVSV